MGPNPNHHFSFGVDMGPSGAMGCMASGGSYGANGGSIRVLGEGGGEENLSVVKLKGIKEGNEEERPDANGATTEAVGNSEKLVRREWKA